MFIRDGELEGLRTCGEDLSGGTAGKEEESEGGAVGGHCVVLCLRQICWVRGGRWLFEEKMNHSSAEQPGGEAESTP